MYLKIKNKIKKLLLRIPLGLVKGACKLARTPKVIKEKKNIKRVTHVTKM